jgi:hypothetical protein
MSNARQTSRTIQVAVRLPLELHDALLRRGSAISPQVVEAVVLMLAREGAEGNGSSTEP